MTVIRGNPEAPVHEQLEEHWPKIAVLLLWKLSRHEPVEILVKDMQAYQEEFLRGEAMFVARGHKDGFVFSIVTAEEAKTAVEHDRATNQGHA